MFEELIMPFGVARFGGNNIMNGYWINPQIIKIKLTKTKWPE